MFSYTLRNWKLVFIVSVVVVEGNGEPVEGGGADDAGDPVEGDDAVDPRDPGDIGDPIEGDDAGDPVDAVEGDAGSDLGEADNPGDPVEGGDGEEDDKKAEREAELEEQRRMTAEEVAAAIRSGEMVTTIFSCSQLPA